VHATNKVNIIKYRRLVKRNLEKKATSSGAVLPLFLPTKLDDLSQSLDGLSNNVSLLTTQMAYNVSKYATFCAGDRAMRSNDPRAKCAGAKLHKGRKPDCDFAEAEPPKGGVQLQSCYMQCPIFYTIIYSIGNSDSQNIHPPLPVFLRGLILS
jgi:hypothetical protein